jgi:lysozyme
MKMSFDEAADLIKKHEGFSHRIYLDTQGVPTGGWGHAFLEGSKLPLDVATKLFWYDFHRTIQEYMELELDLDHVRRSVVLNMIFNLGLTKFLKFKKMLAALREGNYIKASEEMLDSTWAKQVGKRAIELARMMESGEQPED